MDCTGSTTSVECAFKNIPKTYVSGEKNWLQSPCLLMAKRKSEDRQSTSITSTQQNGRGASKYKHSLDNNCPNFNHVNFFIPLISHQHVNTYVILEETENA